jgi:hypothetical protein
LKYLPAKLYHCYNPQNPFQKFKKVEGEEDDFRGDEDEDAILGTGAKKPDLKSNKFAGCLWVFTEVPKFWNCPLP